jgi:hypothetical protein
MNVGQVNDEGVPLDTKVNMRLSRVCGLATRQRVLLTLQGFNELTKNEKGKLFENSIQTYIQYPKELKQKGQKIAMKIFSHAWRSYKSKLVRTPPFVSLYKDLKEEDWMRFVEKYGSDHFAANSQYMQWL